MCIKNNTYALCFPLDKLIIKKNIEFLQSYTQFILGGRGLYFVWPPLLLYYVLVIGQ